NGTSNGTSNGTTTAPATSGKRRFLWHLRRPFKSMSRTLTDFHILPKEPHKTHAPGDMIEGWVVLVTEKPIRITHLTVALHGYVRVFKTTTAVRDSVEPPTGPSSVQYHGNGYATLFQDEQVLCGEGKLDRGRYRFGFSLLFPKHSLPSSINFERGTICYDIVATMVRPTTLDPKLQCNREVILLEKIDIGTVRIPKAKSVVLEPISKSRKRHRKRLNVGLEKAPSIEKSVSFDQRTNTPEAIAGGALPDAEDVESIQQSVISEDQRPTGQSEQGDIRSEASTETGTGSTGTNTGTGTGTGASLRFGDGSGASNAGSGTPTNSHISIKAASTIRADLELTKGGFLPGDTVTVKVSVQHNRRMKSMHGIIVTLFRQTRIDTSPLASLFNPTLTKDQYKKLLNDESFPKSKTGLGGLSLSSTSSISIFRKDLQQNVLPLIVNPTTHDCSVAVTIRIPESVFPTISNVPGEMVSFKYYLEVVLDLGGRLSNQFQSGATASTLLSVPRAPLSMETNSHATQGNMIAPVDTSHLRREKGVIADWFEIIIGTTDSARDAARRAKAKAQAMVPLTADIEPPAQPDFYAGNPQQAPSLASQEDVAPSWPHDSKRPMLPFAGEPSTSSSSSVMRPSLPPPPPINEDAPRYIPRPQIVDESVLTEKERMRRHEMIFLPSHAPVDDGPSAAGPSAAGPSAAVSPSAPPEDDIYGLEGSNIAPIPVPRSSNMEPSAPTLEDLEAPYEAPPPRDALPSSSYVSPLSFSRHPPASSQPAPSAPPATYLPNAASSSANAPSPLGLEDKQELQRLRLLGETSRPPDSPQDHDAGEGGSSSNSGSSTRPSQPSAPANHAAPSVPNLDREDDGLGYDAADPANPRHYFTSYAPTTNGNDQLPAYER
ncbi:hypothetical protein TD95_005173, partial [Thielaviopsis punctulata]